MAGPQMAARLALCLALAALLAPASARADFAIDDFSVGAFRSRRSPAPS
jgi:hypothetical protein